MEIEGHRLEDLANAWIEGHASRIPDLKEQLQAAIGLEHKVLIIEYRQQLRRICQRGNNILVLQKFVRTNPAEAPLNARIPRTVDVGNPHLRPRISLDAPDSAWKPRPERSHVVFSWDDVPSGADEGADSESDSNDPLSEVRRTVRATLDWLKDHPPGFTDDLDNRPGDMGDPNPATPFPHGSRGAVAV